MVNFTCTQARPDFVDSVRCLLTATPEAEEFGDLEPGDEDIMLVFKRIFADSISLIKIALNTDIRKTSDKVLDGCFNLLCSYSGLWEDILRPVIEQECGYRAADFLPRLLRHTLQDILQDKAGQAFIERLWQHCDEDKPRDYMAEDSATEPFTPVPGSLLKQSMDLLKEMGEEAQLQHGQCSNSAVMFGVLECFMAASGSMVNALDPDLDLWMDDKYTASVCEIFAAPFSSCWFEKSASCPQARRLGIDQVLTNSCKLATEISRCKGDISAIREPDLKKACGMDLMELRLYMQFSSRMGLAGLNNYKFVLQTVQCYVNATLPIVEDYDSVCGPAVSDPMRATLLGLQKMLLNFSVFFSELMAETFGFPSM